MLCAERAGESEVLSLGDEDEEEFGGYRYLGMPKCSEK